MAFDPLRLWALVAILSLAVYLGDGVLVGGLGGGLARALIVVAGVATAVWAPVALRWLRRPRLRSGALDDLRRELARQTSAQGVARVLAASIRKTTGATTVGVYLDGRQFAVVPEGPAKEPSATFELGAAERSFGTVRCHGAVRRLDLLPRLLRVGGLALANALLAEQAAIAEQARSQAQAQRDLQHRLTWTVTTQVCTLLEETRERLEGIRLCAGTLPAEVLAGDLEGLSVGLSQLEAFVHDNLKNANAIQASVSPQSLARLPLSR